MKEVVNRAYAFPFLPFPPGRISRKRETVLIAWGARLSLTPTEGRCRTQWKKHSMKHSIPLSQYTEALLSSAGVSVRGASPIGSIPEFPAAILDDHWRVHLLKPTGGLSGLSSTAGRPCP